MEKPRTNAGPIIFAIVLLLMPLLYVLSMGPAFCLLEDGIGFYGVVFRTIYAPLLWLLYNGPAPIDDWIANYLLWWRQLDMIQRIAAT
jgi:hypothetical protein